MLLLAICDFIGLMSLLHLLLHGCSMGVTPEGTLEGLIGVTLLLCVFIEFEDRVRKPAHLDASTSGLSPGLHQAITSNL